MKSRATRKAAVLSTAQSIIPRPSFDLLFSKNNNLTDSITGQNIVTFTRASSGTYVGSDGLIKTAVTNLVLYSSDFNNSTWIKYLSAFVTPNTAIAPDGTLTADTLSKTTTANGLVYQTTPTGGVYTVSFYCKANTATQATVAFTDSLLGRACTFDLVNGTAGPMTNYNGAFPSINGGTASIFPAGNGWYRCVIEGVTLTVPKTFHVGPGAINSTTAESIYVWGAQLEQSATAGEYVPTTTTINSAPRFTHDPITRASLGLLIEEQRTNLLLRSEEFDNAAWTKFQSTATNTAATTDPLGGTSAEKLVPNASLTPGFIYNTTAATITSGSIYTVSVYIKAAELGFAFVCCNVRASSTTTGVCVNLSNGSTSNAGASGTYTVTNAGNGWWRVTSTATASTTAGYLEVSPLAAAGAYGSYTGNGTSGIYIWGAQLEAGYGASSYIPTTTAQVTRTKDVATISGTNFTSLYQQAEGTIFAEYIGGRNNIYNAYGRIATTDVWSLEKGANAVATNFITGPSYISSVSSVNSFVSPSKVAAAWQGSAISTLITDGVLPNFSFGSLTISGTATKLNIGTDINGNIALDGTIARLSYWPKRLPNYILQRITEPSLWTPAQLFSSLSLWLDASDASSIVLNGSTVSQWNDKSGNARNAVQGTASRQPAYTSSGLNGKNVLTFDYDFLSNASFNWGESASSVFIVLSATTTGTFRNIVATGTGSTNQWGYGITNTNAYAIFQILANFQPFSVTPSITDIVCFTSDGRVSTSVSATLTTNGTLNGTQTRSDAGLTSAAGLIIGSNNSVSEPFTGFIGEVVFVSEIVSTNTRQRMEGYLAWKWGLEANLPSNHPYKFFAPTTEDTSFDADALSYIGNVQSADNQILEPNVRKAINNFVVGCKADGIWNSIKSSCILAGARTLAGALQPLKGTAPTNFNFVSGDYNRKTGLVGDGSTKYLNSNRNNNVDPQNNQHISVWASTAATSTASTFPIYIGAGALGNGVTHIGRLSSNGPLYIRNRNNTYQELLPGSAVGLLGMSRSSSDSYVSRVAGVSANQNVTSQTPFDQSIFVFAASSDPGRPSNSRLAFYSIGESLDLALLDTRVTTLMNQINGAIP